MKNQKKLRELQRKKVKEALKVHQMSPQELLKVLCRQDKAAVADKVCPFQIIGTVIYQISSFIRQLGYKNKERHFQFLSLVFEKAITQNEYQLISSYWNQKYSLMNLCKCKSIGERYAYEHIGNPKNNATIKLIFEKMPEDNNYCVTPKVMKEESIQILKNFILYRNQYKEAPANDFM